MSKQRRKYPAEFKKDCIEYFKSSDKVITEVASELGIRYDLLSRWVREDRENQEKAFPGNGNPIEKELHELRKELREVKEERDILKKAMAIFSKK